MKKAAITLKRTYIVWAIIIMVGLGQSCKKSNPSAPATDAVYDPTPYTLVYPAFVDSQYQPPYVSLTNPLTVEGVALGRKLFYETMLSNNITLSCNSCHKQENGFDDPRQFSLGTNGASGVRNAMSLVNLAWGKQFFWDGRRSSIEAQAHDPVTNPIEMETTWPVVVQRLQASSVYPALFKKAFGTTTIDSSLVTKALAQFERTLISYNSRYDQYYYLKQPNVLSTQELAGLAVFTGVGKCVVCHADATFTDHTFRNNGLDVVPVDSGLADFTHLATDYGKFKVPTLRNVALTAPYMHDGRFATLEQVVEFYSTNINGNSPNLDFNLQQFPTGLHLTVDQKTSLVAFLKTLTDSAYITNTNFTNPNQ